MAEYIERGLLLRNIKHNIPYVYHMVASLINCIPSDDAVPVIRCKDCDHADLNIPTSKEFVYCNMWGTISYGNGYCHHSARLTEEGDA